MSDRSAFSPGPGRFGARPNVSLNPTPDIVEADYVVVEAADPSDRLAMPDSPQAPVQPAPAVEAPPLEGMDILRRRALRSAQPRSQKAGPAFWLFGLAVAAAAFWAAGGHSVIRPAFTEAAAPADPGLRIASVISKVDRSGLRPVLQIDGRAVNDGGSAATMPALKIEVQSPGGGSMHYKLGTAGSPVEGGSSFAFSSRLDMPKDGVKTVFVTFAE